jgi:hypothetical protein
VVPRERQRTGHFYLLVSVRILVTTLSLSFRQRPAASFCQLPGVLRRYFRSRRPAFSRNAYTPRMSLSTIATYRRVMLSSPLASAICVRSLDTRDGGGFPPSASRQSVETVQSTSSPCTSCTDDRNSFVSLDDFDVSDPSGQDLLCQFLMQGSDGFDVRRTPRQLHDDGGRDHVRLFSWRHDVSSSLS